MKIKDNMKELYQEGVKNNQDGYGRCVYTYLNRWADMMEKGIEESGLTPKEYIINNAKQLSHDADTEGITGFMYGCAVNILSQVWIYGEELRIWHNHEYNYEGEGCVNPAIMTVSMKE